jgi:hypothetical protein
MELNNLKTGDILLFSAEWSWNPLNIFGKFIEIFTNKPYSHVGMILKDPTWIKQDMKGLYLWESSYEGSPDPQDGKIKIGIEVTPLDIALKQHKEKIYVRQLFGAENKLTINVLQKIHKIVYDKPYDYNLFDWLSAFLRTPINGSRKYTRYFCSAFVACIYTEAEIIDKNTDWSIIRPSDFNEGDTHLNWSDGCRLEGLFEIK